MNAKSEWTSDRLGNIMSLDALKATSIRDIALKTKGLIRLTSGEPDFVTPEHIIAAAKRALDEGFTFYTQTSGIPEFREAIAEKMRKEHQIEIDPDSEVIATPGAIEGIFLAVMGVLNPGDEVLMPDPGYVGYPTCVRFANAVEVPVPLSGEEGFRLKPEEIEKRITAATRMVILNSPSNPTGMVMTAEDLEMIAEIAKRHNLIILTDDAYEKIVYDGLKHHSIMSLPGMKERTILIGSFSKTYAMTGWRIGYLVADRNLTQDLLKIQSSIVLSTNGVVQKAAAAALEGPQDCVDRMLKEYDRRRHFIVQKLNSIDGLSCELPKGAFFVFLNTRKIESDSLKLTEYLIRNANVAVYPGIAYGKQGEGHIRLTYAASIEQIETAVERMEAGLKKLM